MSAQLEIRAPRILPRPFLSSERLRSRLSPGAVLQTWRLDLPQFPLDVALRGVAAAQPCVLAQSGAPDARVEYVNGPAASRGARVALSLRALSTFGPEIRRVSRQSSAETHCRELLVRWLHALGCTTEVSADAGGALTLLVTSASSRAEDFWRAKLRRDLRAFGFRSHLEPVAHPHLRNSTRGPVLAGGSRGLGFTSRIELPWCVAQARELIPATTRLLDELRVIHEAEQQSLRWIQWTFHEFGGARHHHVLDIDASLPPMARLGAWTREKLHRMADANPWGAVTLKAGFGSGNAG